MKNSVTVRFTSGREEKFEMEFFGGAGAPARLQKFVENPALVLKTADEVLILPGSAIECISIKSQKGDAWSNVTDLRPAKRIT
jgi:hypothetical protein